MRINRTGGICRYGLASNACMRAKLKRVSSRRVQPNQRSRDVAAHAGVVVSTWYVAVQIRVYGKRREERQATVRSERHSWHGIGSTSRAYARMEEMSQRTQRRLAQPRSGSIRQQQQQWYAYRSQNTAREETSSKARATAAA